MEIEDTAQIHQRIARLARELHNRSGDDADAVINALVDHAVAAVPSAEYAGITVTANRRHVTTPAATHRYPVILDEIQQQHQQGPCVTAVWEQHTVRVNDLSAEFRWPAYRRDALAATPIRSIMSFQLFTAHQTMGALNVYSEVPNAFDLEAEEIGIVFATHAALVWDSVRREREFRSALASRDIIGQAKGVVMERFQVDAVQAFELLKKLSQESNSAVTEIARRVTKLDGAP